MALVSRRLLCLMDDGWTVRSMDSTLVPTRGTRHASLTRV